MTIKLTPRETQVIRLLAEGETAGRIADRLHITRKSVTHHIDHIYVRLGARNAPHAINLAWLNGLLGGGR